VTTTFDPRSTRPAGGTVVHPRHRAAARRGRRKWPLFGVGAGVCGLAAALLAAPPDAGQGGAGVAVLDELERGDHHLAFVLGLVSVGCLLVASTGWKRWADERAGDDLAARTIPTALAATATLNVVGTAMAGSLALHLPGGADEGLLSAEGQLAHLHHLELGLLLGWWTTVVAALCVAGLAFRGRGVLPPWMGVVSVALALPVIGVAGVAAMPGLPGLVMPVWLVVISAGMVLSPSANRPPSLLR
jgi:hypothetical protein